MPYIKKTCKAGWTVDYEYYYSVRYNSGGTRAKKEKLTREAQKRINLRKAARECTWLLNENFRPDDLYITFTYRVEDRPDEQQLRKHIKSLLDKLRIKQRKAGQVLKYVWTAEVGKRGATHIHMVMNQIPVKVLREAWRYGYVHITPLDDTGQYRALAEYLVKYASRTEEAVGHHIGRRYNPSRSLIRPKPKRTVITGRRKIPDRIPVPKGYYLDKQSERRGIHEVTGYEYLSYTLIRLPERRAPDCTQ